jgi:hypothetical protein
MRCLHSSTEQHQLSEVSSAASLATFLQHCVTMTPPAHRSPILIQGWECPYPLLIKSIDPCMQYDVLSQALKEQGGSPGVRRTPAFTTSSQILSSSWTHSMSQTTSGILAACCASEFFHIDPIGDVKTCIVTLQNGLASA